MKKNIFVIIFICFSLSLIASGKLKEKPYIETLEKHTNIEITNEYALLTWDAFEELPNLNADNPPNTLRESIGYLIYLYEEEKEKTKESILNTLKHIPGYIGKTYYTKQRCLYLPNLNSNNKYLVNILCVKTFVNESNNSLELISVEKANYKKWKTVNNKWYIDINTPKKYKEKKFDKECKQEKIPEVNLKDLYNNREFYLGKIIKVKGYFHPKEAFHPKGASSSKSSEQKWISNIVYKGETAIVDKDYVLAVPGYKEYLINVRMYNPKYNYIEYVGYLGKMILHPESQQEEIRYSFSVIDVVKVSKK